MISLPIKISLFAYLGLMACSGSNFASDSKKSSENSDGANPKPGSPTGGGTGGGDTAGGTGGDTSGGTAGGSTAGSTGGTTDGSTAGSTGGGANPVIPPQVGVRDSGVPLGTGDGSSSFVCKGTNLVVNSDFEQRYASFQTDYTREEGCASQFSSRAYTPSVSLTYTINTDPGVCHSRYVRGVSGNKGQMLVVNLPAAGQGQKNFWCQTIAVKPNTVYELTARMRIAAIDVQSSLSEWTINGTVFSKSFDPKSDWRLFESLWNSGSATSAVICGRNIAQHSESGDLVIDDIGFRSCP